MKCPQCGFENEESSKFCKNCNTPLSKRDYSEDNPYIKKKINEDQPSELISDEKEEQKSSLRKVVLVLLLLTVIVVSLYLTLLITQKTQPIPLNASVSFTETQFIIENDDNFDWLNVKMEVNGSFLSSGFIFEIYRIKAGGTYTIGALQFAKKDGTRFNLFIYKPQKIDISCDTPKGENAFWAGNWE